MLSYLNQIVLQTICILGFVLVKRWLDETIGFRTFCPSPCFSKFTLGFVLSIVRWAAGRNHSFSNILSQPMFQQHVHVLWVLLSIGVVRERTLDGILKPPIIAIRLVVQHSPKTI